MALISCPECQQSVSNQASTCPHCGYTISARNDPVVDYIHRWRVRRMMIGIIFIIIVIVLVYGATSH